MVLTTKQIAEFKEIITPVIEFLAKNHDPHATIIVTSGRAELTHGSCSTVTNEFVKD